MAGIKNDILFGLNGDFSNSNNTSPSESNGLITNGQLWIGSTALNAGSTHISVGEITSPDNSITLGYSSPNITARVNRNVVQDLHTARFIVSSGGLTDGANYTTIQAAINAAQGTGVAQTIFIQPGTYTENLTLVPNVNLSAYICDAQTPNVTILGTCTLTAAGTVSISGICLRTNGSFFLAVTGTLASVVNLNNCNLICSNNTGISLTSTSASAAINIVDCIGNITTTGIALFSASSAGSIILRKCVIGNSGASTTANTCASTGFLGIERCSFVSAISISDTAFANITFSRINPPSNTTAVTVTSTSATPTLLEFIRLDGGTSSALSVGAGASVAADNIVIASTNTNAITGSGSIQLGNINFVGTSSSNNVTTQTYFQGSGWQLIKTQTASTSANLTFTDVSGYKIFAMVVNNLLPATNATQLQLLVSNNNGSSFAGAGYNSGVNYLSYNSATVTNVNSTAAALLTSNASNGAGMSGTILLTVNNGRVYGQTTYTSTDSTVSALGNVVSSTGVVFNAFRLQMSSGNLTSGSVSLYGLVN